MSKELAEFLSHEIGMSPLNSEDSALVDNHDFIIQKIAQYLEMLIVKNHEKLFQILYRIDIPEMKIEAAFSLGKTKLTCKKLAELILERTLQKIQSQKDFDKGSDFK